LGGFTTTTYAEIPLEFTEDIATTGNSDNTSDTLVEL
jgi:hypothetical protein